MSSSAEKWEILLESIKKEARYCVVECSVFTEKRVSETLGRILGIDWKESESLGYGSGSLSFDNKIRLIRDLKGVSKEVKTKFQTFMSIRNKFVHLDEIDSFQSYFVIIKSAKERKKELKSWFPQLRWDAQDIDVERLYKSAFFLLTLDLNSELIDIETSHVFEKGKSLGAVEALEDFMAATRDKLSQSREGEEMLEEIFEKIFRKGRKSS